MYALQSIASAFVRESEGVYIGLPGTTDESNEMRYELIGAANGVYGLAGGANEVYGHRP